VSKYVWVAHLAMAIVLGWGGLTWLVTATSPQTPWARLAFLLALAVGLYATACLLAYAICLLLWPGAPRLAVEAFSRRQGLMWAGLLSSLALLRLSGELSAFTTGLAFLTFASAQYTQLRHAG
jgi:hypothetical protein